MEENFLSTINIANIDAGIVFDKKYFYNFNLYLRHTLLNTRAMRPFIGHPNALSYLTYS